MGSNWDVNYDHVDYLFHYGVEYNTDTIFYKDAFKSSDGSVVPIVWQGYAYDLDLVNFLGYAVIENRDDGVVAKCTFNQTDQGTIVKDLFENGNELAISIYANGIQYDNLGYPVNIKKVKRATVKAVIVMPICAKPTERVKE